MTRYRKLGIFALWLVAGAVIGSLVGELLGVILPAGVVREFFTTKTAIGFDEFTLNLAVLDLTLGFNLFINVIGVLGILFAGYYFRWYR
jgi:hypothetical protein